MKRSASQLASCGAVAFVASGNSSGVKGTIAMVYFLVVFLIVLNRAFHLVHGNLPCDIDVPYMGVSLVGSVFVRFLCWLIRSGL